MEYIKQEQEFGCVFACIAMIVEIDYWTVRNGFPKYRFKKELGKETGISATDDAESYLFYNGYVGHTNYSTVGFSQIKRKSNEWIKEFAPIHIVSVVLNGHIHACVLKDGIIYDPYREGKYTFEDYEKVNSITGFWSISCFKK